MKRIVFALFSIAFVTTMNAQDQFSASDFATSDLNGTSRYVGLGGALDALGGDISVMGSNPAGTAIYKKTDMAFTAGVLFTGEDGQLGHDGTRASLDQAGIVFTMDQDKRDSKGLQYINFGFNYQKKKNHFANADLGIKGLDGTLSQTNQIADLTNQSYEYNSYGMLTGIAYDAGLLNNVKDGSGNHVEYTGIGAQAANYRRATYGATSQFDLNLSFNISNQFFWGVSMGVYDVNYNRESMYSELGNDNVAYDIRNWYETNGNGIDVKLGLIWRPIKESPFRIGLAVHTPTWYRLEDTNGTDLTINNKTIYDNADPYEYDYRTPWKFGLSLGHTVGNFLAIGAQYEVSDLSACHYSSVDWENDDYFRLMNDKINDQLKTQHTVRFGLELKPTTNFALRFGYNYVSSPIKETAWKESFCNGYNGETDYINWKGTNRITCGFGYRFNGGYFDMSYQYQTQKGDFYAFIDPKLQPTEIKNNRSQLMATLGFRF